MQSYINESVWIGGTAIHAFCIILIAWVDHASTGHFISGLVGVFLSSIVSTVSSNCGGHR